MAASATQGKNPTELLAMQTQTLLDLYQLQQQQQDQIKQLVAQQRTLNEHLENIESLLEEDDNARSDVVEVTDFNMGFGSLVFFLTKFWFASLLVGIVILFLLYVLVTATGIVKFPIPLIR